MNRFKDESYEPRNSSPGITTAWLAEGLGDALTVFLRSWDCLCEARPGLAEWVDRHRSLIKPDAGANFLSIEDRTKRSVVTRGVRISMRIPVRELDLAPSAEDFFQQVILDLLRRRAADANCGPVPGDG